MSYTLPTAAKTKRLAIPALTTEYIASSDNGPTVPTKMS